MSISDFLKRREHRGVLIVACVSLLVALFIVFIGFGLQGMVANNGDPYRYKEIARHYADHGFDKLTRRGAMLYPQLIWIIYEFGGGDATILTFHVVFHVGSCTIIYLIAKKVFNERTALIAGLVTTFHPMILRYVGDFHTEAMLVFMTALTVWCAMRFNDRPTIPNGVLLGVVGMLGTLTKGVLLPVLVVYAAVFFFKALRRWKENPNQLFAVLAIGVTSALIVAPWTYRNYQVTGGRFVLLTPGSSDAFLRGYIFTRMEFATLQKPPYTVAENESNDLFRRIAKSNNTKWEEDEVTDEQNNKRYMMQYIKDHPLDTVRKFVVGLFTFWYQMTSLKNSLIPGVLTIGSWVLAFIGLKRAREEKRAAWLLWMPIVVTNILVAALIPLGRYSVPIIPLLVALAAFGVDTLLERRKRRAEATPA